MLDRVHLEHEYNKQEAFRDLANQVLRIADSETGRIAKPDDVINYLKTRIEGNLRKVEPISEMQKAVHEKEKLPPNIDSVLSEQEQLARTTKAKEAKQDLTKATDKVKEFKKSENVFKNFIMCLRGSA